ncbi:hypothetical protein ACLHIL_01735 [Trueperella sp. LYQ143]
MVKDQMSWQSQMPQRSVFAFGMSTALHAVSRFFVEPPQAHVIERFRRADMSQTYPVRTQGTEAALAQLACSDEPLAIVAAEYRRLCSGTQVLMLTQRQWAPQSGVFLPQERRRDYEAAGYIPLGMPGIPLDHVSVELGFLAYLYAREAQENRRSTPNVCQPLEQRGGNPQASGDYAHPVKQDYLKQDPENSAPAQCAPAIRPADESCATERRSRERSDERDNQGASGNGIQENTCEDNCESSRPVSAVLYEFRRCHVEKWIYDQLEQLARETTSTTFKAMCQLALATLMADDSSSRYSPRDCASADSANES